MRFTTDTPDAAGAELASRAARGPKSGARMRALIAMLAVAISAVLGYCAWPLVAAAELATVAERGNPAAAMDRVDLQLLRTSLERQIIRAYLRQHGHYERLSTVERGLVGSVGETVAVSLLDDMLTPENVVSLLASGQVARGTARDLVQLPRLGDVFRSLSLHVLTDSYFEGLTSFVVVGGEGAGYRVHLQLSGAAWKLSGIDLPQDVRDRLAREVVRLEKSED
jgi:hypothetical protein